MKTEDAAARAAQTGNGGENAGKSDAKPLFWLAKRRKQMERYAILDVEHIDNNIFVKYNIKTGVS
jgi:hypothetical protein